MQSLNKSGLALGGRSWLHLLKALGICKFSTISAHVKVQAVVITVGQLLTLANASKLSHSSSLKRFDSGN